MVANDLSANDLFANDLFANDLSASDLSANDIGTDYFLNNPDGSFLLDQFTNEAAKKNDDFADGSFANNIVADDDQTCRQLNGKLTSRGSSGKFCTNTGNLDDFPSDTFVTTGDLLTFWCPALLNSAPGLWAICSRSNRTGENYYPVLEGYLCSS